MPIRKWNKKRVLSNKSQNSMDPVALTPEKLSFLQRFLKINEYILGIGVLCYLLGFIIENIYLGSFGVANFDALKVRYILVGGLFVVFLFSVGIPVYDLILHYYRQDHGSLPRILYRLGWNSLLLFGWLTIIGGIYNILAGPYNQIPVGVPILNPPQPIEMWLVAALPRIFDNTLHFVGGILILLAGLVVVIFFVLVLFNPKIEGRRAKRKENIRDFFQKFSRKGFLTVFWFIVLFFLLSFFLSFSSSLTTFMVSNQVKILSSTTTYQINAAYGRFFIAAVAAYLTISCTFLLIVLRWEINKDEVMNTQSSKPLSRFTGWSYIAGILISAVIPIYSFGVYPSIPQQIGGGLIVSVSITSGNKQIEKQILTTQCSQYLLDRTVNSTLVLCIDEQTKKYRVIEIPGDQIDSIEYHGTP